MEVEVKFRLNELNYQKSITLFSTMKESCLMRTDFQQNLFLDTNNELGTKRVTFRLRKAESSTQTKCLMTVKGLDTSNRLEGGIMKVSESECEINLEDFNQMTEKPKEIANFKIKYPLINSILECVNSNEFEIVGKFNTKRSIFQFEKLFVEIDHTKYEFGDAYEIEVESLEPNKTKAKLEEILTKNNIEFDYSKRSKFGNMKAKSIL